MSDLMELAERCEKASGVRGDGRGSLNKAIADALGMGAAFIGGSRKWDFTGSLDAAMTLVPENCGVNIDNGPCHWICLGKQKPMGRVDLKYPRPDYGGEGDSWLTVSAIAATPALALCAAALRSLSTPSMKE